MKLSLSIIFEHLKTYTKQYHMNIHHNSLHLSRPIFYTGETTLESDTLYISKASSLPKTITFKKGAALICLSTPPNNYINEKLDMIIINDSDDIFSLSNKIHEIFDRFEYWDLHLQQSISALNPLQYILDNSESIFGNGLSIMDSDFFIIAESHLNKAATEYNNLDESGRIPIDQVNSFKNDKTYRDIAKKREIFLYPNEVLPYRCLCKNIFLKDEFIFRIIVTETNQELKEIDSILLEHLSLYFDQLSNHIRALHQEENIILTSLFQSILAGNSFNMVSFDKELNKIGWKQNNSYLIAYIQPSSHDIYNTTMFYFCSKIMREFKQTFAFIYNDFIVVIINIDKIKITKDEFFNIFNYFIREANFRVGFSNYYSGLNNLKEYFVQARVALEIGLNQKPTIWSHKFSEYIFPYILSKITDELPAQFLYSPIITRIQKYDLENQTEYLKTLKIYLWNNKNAVQTAKDLFIHRATIIYRLERIKEIGKTDLNNNDELIHLNLSFKLMDQENT